MSEKIDINTADVATLTTISGIGPALAERIVEYRETVHPFEEVIELAAVPGISEKMVRSFEALVTVQTDVPETPVPPNLDEVSETPLLDAPEEVILLGAPDQPEALLAAEVADDTPAVEEIAVVEAAAAEAAETAEVEAATAEPVIEEVEDVAEEVEEETAVPLTESPRIEELPLAEPANSIRPEPDLFAVAPTHPSAEWEAKAQRRGCFSTLLGATFGAILGAALTLAILAAINGGNLNYADSNSQLRRQLDTEIISRTNELNQLSTRVSLAATQEADANQALESDFTTADEAINETLANNERLINDLEQQLQDVAGAAETFTDFLDGLRGLLNDLEGATATPTPTPAPAEETVSPTPTPTPISSDTATPSATTAVSPTGVPTRTPQPTATSFTFPTNTPAPQP